jgi:DNA-binding LacI/PurR family transcriptional regulator
MATIGDVAQRAGVSASTVSYVLSGRRTISAPTKARVQAAITELGYQPHAGARALASSKTDIIALVAPLREAVEVNVILQFVDGVVLAARDSNYDVLLITQDETDGVDRVLQGSKADAIIAMDIAEDDPRLNSLAQATIPAVLIGRPHDSKGISCVDLDFEQAGVAAVSHLIELGHRNIGLLGAPVAVWERHTSFLERVLRGARQTADRNKATLTALPSPADAPGAQESLQQILEIDPSISALVVHNESALPHVLSHLGNLGKKVPEDMAIVALCPRATAENQLVPVTSIDLPAVDIGRAAVELTLSLLDGSSQSQTRLLPAVVTKRGTSVPPKST